MIGSLPARASLEETFYPPSIPAGKFEREHNYPLYFMKMVGDTVPVSSKYGFNAGEAGLDARRADYLLRDSFTAGKFRDPRTCRTMPAECAFFEQLSAGLSAHYQLLADFRYAPPWFLPQIEIDFVNPEFRIYERIK